MPAGAFMGAAGGAACGDLIRISLARRRRPRRRRGLRGLRLRGDDRRRLGGGDARVGRAGARRGARRHGARSPPSSAGCRRASCTRPTWPPTRCTARSARPRAPAPRCARRSRPHAGRDERRGRLGGRGAARPATDAVAVTLELWADAANDAEASCCSAHAVRVARSVAHGMGMPHFTLDLRAEFRAGVVEPFLAGYAAGETPNPCVRCNGHVRLDAMLEFADRARRRRPRHRALRARERGRAAARGGRPGQGPDLHAVPRWRRRRWRGCASRSAS